MDLDVWARVGQIAISGVVGFAGGLLAGERQDKRSLRTLEALVFAAGTLRKICENVLNSANATPNWAQSIAGAYTDANSLEVVRNVLKHVRAVDLPDTVDIDQLARIDLIFNQAEGTLKKASNGQTGSFIQDLQQNINDLDPIINALSAEMDLLQRFWLMKLLSKLNPLGWFRKKS
ncbi:MAG: hypothetical protein REJ23_07330 [Brevundimonas sp.]|nr:hypothetical protein [Brevundimonas sp.]